MSSSVCPASRRTFCAPVTLLDTVQFLDSGSPLAFSDLQPAGTGWGSAPACGTPRCRVSGHHRERSSQRVVSHGLQFLATPTDTARRPSAGSPLKGVHFALVSFSRAP